MRRPWHLERRHDAFLACLLFFFGLVLYTVTRSTNPMFDGLIYCSQVLTGDPRLFIMGQHPLYGPTAFAFSGLAARLTPALSTWGAMRLLSSLSGAAVLALTFLACRRLGATRPGSVAAVLLMGLSLEFWNHAVNVEYIMPNCAVLAAFLLACVSHLTKPRASTALLIGALWGLAMLAHLSHALLAFPAAVCLTAGGGRWRRTLPALGLAGVLFLLGYGVLGWMRFGHVRPTELLSWALHETATGKTVFRTSLVVWRPKNLLMAPLWQLGAMVRPTHLRHLLWGHPRFNGLGPVAAAITACTLLVGGVGALRAGLKESGRDRRGLVALAAWVGAYWLFFSCWCPSEEAWWVSNLIPISAAVALATRSLWGTRSSWLGTLLLGCTIIPLALLNFTDRYGILYNMRTRNPQIGHLARLGLDASPKDVVLWLGYLEKREWGGRERLVSSRVSDESMGFLLSHLFTTAKRIGTLELLRSEHLVRCLIESRMSHGATVWVSLARCTPEETLQWTEYWSKPSARAMARLFADYALAPTAEECLWKIIGHRGPGGIQDSSPPSEAIGSEGGPRPFGLSEPYGHS